jgi:hypothetical protein
MAMAMTSVEHRSPGPPFRYAQASQLNPRSTEADMAKGQQKSNREVRKPKKSAAQKSAAAGPATVTSTFATPSHKAGKKR